MNDLIPITYDNDRPTVSGRALHEALEVKTAYKDWFPRMCGYGFAEGTDFNPLNFEQVREEGGREVKRSVSDHQLTIDMAKELCMIQRTEKGKQCRLYFLEVEKRWNSPEAIMARALQLAERKLTDATRQNRKLAETVAVQNQQIAELQPKGTYYDLVLNCKDLISISAIAKDYGWSAKRMNNYLHEKGVQYRQGKIWLLYQKHAELGYTSTKTHSAPGNDGEIHSYVHTYWTQKGRLFIYGLLKADGILPLIEKGD